MSRGASSSEGGAADGDAILGRRWNCCCCCSLNLASNSSLSTWERLDRRRIGIKDFLPRNGDDGQEPDEVEFEDDLFKVVAFEDVALEEDAGVSLEESKRRGSLARC